MKGKRAVLYCRVSTDEQRKKGNSIEFQEELLREYCLRNGIEVTEVFIDNESAKDFNRPSYVQMQEHCRYHHRRIDFILVFRWDRWSRNSALGQIEINNFKAIGIEVHSLEQGIVAEDPSQKFIRTISLGIGEYENGVKSVRTKESMKARAEKGYWCHKPPKGYKANPITKIMEPNENATLISDAFSMVASRTCSVLEAREFLIEGGLSCSRSGIYHILGNPLYKGVIKIKSKGEEPEEYVKGLHKPIVTEETWEAVQNLMNSKSRPIVRQKEILPEHVLRSLLECKDCGKKLTAGRSRGNGGQYDYYQCNTKGCGERYRTDLANSILEQKLHILRPEPEVIELFYMIIEKKFDQNDESRRKKLNSLRSEQSKVESQILNLDEHMASAKLNVSDYNRMVSNLSEKIAQTKEQLEELEAMETDYTKYIKEGASIIENLGNYYIEGDVTVKRRILGSILDGNLVFDTTDYRTIPYNQVINSYAFTFKALDSLKTEKPSKIAELSSLAPPLGLEPRTY